MSSETQKQRYREGYNLKGKTAVVTGSSRGIGKGIAEDLGRYGANVVINYISSEDKAHDVADSINNSQGDGEAEVIKADISDMNEVESLHQQTKDIFGDIDILVNNAGINIDKKFVNLNQEDWQRVLDVNLTGTFNCTKQFFDDIKEAEQGRVINISSVVGQQGNYGQANYATSKSGLFGMTRTLALELAPHGSTANCVAPGFTETDMLKGVSEEVRGKIQEKIPLRRFAEVEEISKVVAFVASDHSSYMTGQVLGINGGMHW